MTRQELHNKMVEIVGQIVEHYETDFYDYDVETLDKAHEKNRGHYIWIVRECGTFMLPVDNACGMEDWFYAIKKSYGIDRLTFFEIFRGNDDDWMICNSNAGKVLKEFKKEHHFDMEVTDMWGRQIWKSVGLFDNKNLAEEYAQEVSDYRGGHFWYVNQVN